MGLLFSSWRLGSMPAFSPGKPTCTGRSGGGRRHRDGEGWLHPSSPRHTVNISPLGAHSSLVTFFLQQQTAQTTAISNCLFLQLVRQGEQVLSPR